MEGLKHTAKIREYCDYIDEHLLNVGKAWKILQEKCGDIHPFYDDHLWAFMDSEIKNHDISKMAPEEFIQYQRQFFPVGEAPERDNPVFAAAWRNHKNENPHHWENWTKQNHEIFPNERACHCVMMVCDWMAMGMKFGDTVEEFYKRKKDEIELPDWAVKLIREIFARLSGGNKEGEKT